MFPYYPGKAPIVAVSVMVVKCKFEFIGNKPYDNIQIDGFLFRKMF